jgi:hypothetical protein
MTMSRVLAAVHDGTVAAGAAGMLYTATISTTALTAALSRSPARRRAAREVLTLLLCRRT